MMHISLTLLSFVRPYVAVGNRNTLKVDSEMAPVTFITNTMKVGANNIVHGVSFLSFFWSASSLYCTKEDGRVNSKKKKGKVAV
jgi:hypothetical protein